MNIKHQGQEQVHTLRFLGLGRLKSRYNCLLLTLAHSGNPNKTIHKTYLIEDILQLELSQGRALDVLDSAQVLRHPLAILFPHRLHLLLTKLLAHLRVVAQIGLSADDETRHAGAVVVDLGEPLFSHVLKTGG